MPNDVRQAWSAGDDAIITAFVFSCVGLVLLVVVPLIIWSVF